jgi:hypothetical protein
MAELVDALVSNTSGSNAVGVQFPLRVLKKSESESECVSNREHSYFFDFIISLPPQNASVPTQSSFVLPASDSYPYL